MWTTHYDVLIVGAGVAGSALAHALATLPGSKLRIAVLERSLVEPDRIVGEILQPGGVEALSKLGLASCLENIDAMHVKGYCVLSGDQTVEIPYPETSQGRSFHHGRFITNMRDAARKSVGVDLIEATVTDLIHCHFERKVIGVQAVQKEGAVDGEDGDKVTYFADLVIVADGCFSKFRPSIMGPTAVKPSTRSHFVALILEEDAPLPLHEYGTVVLVEGAGPVLLYQISKHETCMFVDVKSPVPSDLKAYLLTEIIPKLPIPLRCAAQCALTKNRLRRTPNSFLPAVQQGACAGVFLLGDAWNMRHPLTGGGMTVALDDVLLLRSLLGTLPDFKDRAQTTRVLRKWHWQRKPVASTVNIFSVALHDLFSGHGDDLGVLRTGCLKYLERGGECLNGPAALLAVLAPSPLRLGWHFLSIIIYSIWLLFVAKPTLCLITGKSRRVAPSFDEYPALLRRSASVIRTASALLLPLLASELRWWAPRARPKPTTEPFQLDVTMTVYFVWFFVPMALWTFFVVLR
ncbi:squalene epoxidase-domain-containing protein [Mycena alexandri]|uniref:Squalene monooxygenase n=1 Tax=Mycena alexandri TaxID=1745969 RepID=A0AAD6T267_9AGAR|nr:squalene epoxidase-domain-containing protein [Mycena alexandri]